MIRVVHTSSSFKSEGSNYLYMSRKFKYVGFMDKGNFYSYAQNSQFEDFFTSFILGFIPQIIMY